MDDPIRRVFIGFDPREAAAFAVAKHSAKRRMTQPIPIRGLVLSELQRSGLYTRPIEYRDGPDGNKIMWDVISDAPQSTEHANARFLVGELAGDGWALFMDGDVLVRGNLTRLFDSLDDRLPLYCVKHREMPDASGVKMDAQVQLPYPRKLWSSIFCLNVQHPANRPLTPDAANSLPGRDLHRFAWLADEQIGDLGPEWNHLVGISRPPQLTPRVVHFTLGTPDMRGYENCEYADEWRAELTDWAVG